MEDKSQVYLALTIALTFLIIGIYLSPIFEEMVLLSFDSTLLGIGFFCMFIAYKKIVSESYDKPELQTTKSMSGMLYIYALIVGLVIFFISYYFIHIFGYEESYANFYKDKSMGDVLNRDLTNVEQFKYTFEVKNRLFLENYGLYLNIFAGISMYLFALMTINFIPTNIKDKINKKLNREIFDLSEDSIYLAKKILAKQVKAINLSDYKAFDMKDKKRMREVDGKKIPGIFAKDIFHEAHPIWIFFENAREKRVNPVVFELLNDPFNKLTITTLTLEQLTKSKNTRNRILTIVLNHIYKNYKNTCGEDGQSLKSLFEKFENNVEYVIMELAYLNNVHLGNFSLGQIYRFAKKDPHIRELLGAIDNAHMKYVKYTGVFFYMKYYLYKKQRERQLEMDELKSDKKESNINSMKIEF